MEISFGTKKDKLNEKFSVQKKQNKIKDLKENFSQKNEHNDKIFYIKGIQKVEKFFSILRFLI